MKSLLLASTALTVVAAVGSAGAADMAVKARPAPVVVVNNWTGFYVGLNAGGAWGSSNSTSAVDCSALNAPPGYLCNSSDINGPARAAAVAGAAFGKNSASAFTGGFQAGYNFQQGRTVYGVETDIDSFKLHGGRMVSGSYATGSAAFPIGTNYTVTTGFGTDWLWTLRGRAGWLVQPNFLIFGTGGLALTRIGTSYAYADNGSFNGPAGANGGGSSTKAGLALGGGLEWALSRNWTVKAEYLYLNFGSVGGSATITVPGFTGTPGYSQGIGTSADLTAHIARTGVNYKF